ncbi:kinase-like domain-containing protein [Mycena epipterygia]|nr:kinase-like domain-containing protein [Mycena epipterygia]
MSNSSIDTTFGPGFEERNRALTRILEHLGTLYPQLGVVALFFKAWVGLELKRRTNDPKVATLLVKVQDTMTSFVHLFSLVQPDQLGALEEHISGLSTAIAHDIQDCGNFCDRYSKHSVAVKYIKKSVYDARFSDIATRFQERRREVDSILLLATSTRLAADSAPPAPEPASGASSTSSSATLHRTFAEDSLRDDEHKSTALPEPESGASSPVDAFLHNQEQQTALLARGLPPEDLHDALRSCEQRICTSLLAVLDSRDAKRAVLLLEGARAQSFLDAVQDALDRGSLPSAERTAQARRLILRLSEARDQLPSSLFITGVADRDEHPTFCGGFGDIYRATYNGGTVAVKRIRVFIAGAEAQRTRLQFCREALVWQTLRHKYILPLLGIDRETFPPAFCMVSPWMKHGTVLKHLSEHGRARVDTLVRSPFHPIPSSPNLIIRSPQLLQIAEGLAYLHTQNIVHGDLRGTNILVADDWSACLADFGLTSAITDAAPTTGAGALTSTANHAGSLRWFAPELIAPTFFGCERFVRTRASDCYAFACVCLELHTGSPPFADVSPDVAAMLKVVAGERPPRPDADGMSDAFVGACWHCVGAEFC